MKHSATSRLLGATLILGVGVLGLAGCSVSQEEASEGWSAKIPAPIAIDASAVAGTVVDIPLDNSAYIIVPDGTETDYRASVAGSSVNFVAGSNENGLVMRPGLKAEVAGDSTIELINTKNGAVTQFTVHVE